MFEQGKIFNYSNLINDLLQQYLADYCSISAFDVKTVYNILQQYRLLAEFIIKYGHDIGPENGKEENELELRGVRIAKFMRYYAFVALGMKIEFLVEVIAQDIRVLCETAFHWNR